ncbi:MAG TPA: glycoside hydrolase family 3 C-terminal domain-containing protein [Polyangiaceae bacterium]|nr:glycoside hydrolase family 3 C-terminal domain-containing protein [Polyangiaceae bacterium]
MLVRDASRRPFRIAYAALALSACLSPRFPDGTGGSAGGVAMFGGIGGASNATGGGTGGMTLTPGGGGETGPSPVGGLDMSGNIDTSSGQPPAVCSSFQPERVIEIPDPEADPTLAARVDGMPVAQRVRQMYGFPNCDYSGTQCFQQQAIDEQDLPVWEMRDGPRGVRRLGAGPATAFPVPVARAASFDVGMEERIGDVIGRQMLAFKYDLMLAPTVNTLRHPGWGRSQETYGEDTVVLGNMGAALVRGLQQHVPTCIKHFAANTTEGNRESVSANMDEQTLREIYTRQFEIAIEKSDPACVMAAYNKVNNTYSAQNQELLTTLLRDEWDWKGFVISDWGAVKSTLPSALAGTDLEMPNNMYYGSLLDQVPSNPGLSARISQAVRRVLNVKRHFGQLDDAYRTNDAYQGRAIDETIINQPDVLALVEEASEKGMVLLENKDQLLPLDQGARVLVVGPDGDVARLGDSGSSQVAPADNQVVTPLAGLRAVGTNHGATVDFEPTLAGALTAAPNYDAVILVVGMQHTDEGEGYGGGDDRESLDLNGPHPELWTQDKPRAWIEQLANVTPNLVVVLEVGGAIVEPSLDRARALLYSFYPGQAGGTALARLLFGDANFSGKLPFTVATDPTQYPVFGDSGEVAQYDYLHGYRKFDREGLTPRYYFGSGISYTTFEYSNLGLPCSAGVTPNGLLVAEVDVENTGMVAGSEIVQLYVGYPNSAVRRSVKELKAFTRVDLAPGEKKRVQLTVPARDFRYYDEANGWSMEFVEHQVLVGPSADPARLLPATFDVVPN